MKVIQAKQVLNFSYTDRRRVLTLIDTNIEEKNIKGFGVRDFEKIRGRFVVVSPYGTKPNRYRVWSRHLMFQSACEWAEWILESERSAKSVYLLPVELLP